MKVRDVMTTEPVTVRPDTPYRELVERILERGISGLPVVDETGGLVGIVTEADLIAKEAYGGHRRRGLEVLGDLVAVRQPWWVRKASGQTAADLMTPAPVTAAPGDDLATAARRMLEAGVKRLPVVEGGRVVGVLSRHDLLKWFRRSAEDVAADVARVVTDPLAVPEDADIRVSVADGVVTLEGSVRYDRDVAATAATIAAIRGVVAVDNRLVAREPDPRLTGPMVPRLR